MVRSHGGELVHCGVAFHENMRQEGALPRQEPAGGQGVRTPPGKSQVAIGFLRNTGMYGPPSRSNWTHCLLRQVHTELRENMLSR